MKRFSKAILRSAVTLLVLSSSASAQATCLARRIDAGGEDERYLRALELVGLSAPTQWTIRPNGTRQRSSTPIGADQPWARECFASSINPPEGVSLLVPSAGLVENSSYPYGFNDGPVWAGKGLTGVLQGGFVARRGPFTLAVDPVAFYAQNLDFSIADNNQSGDRRFGDFLRPDAIDLPQRFGSRPYARVAPGESELRVDALGVAVGMSTRAEFWGPAYDHPLLLGNNAGGIPRLFAGISRPIAFHGVTIDGRMFWGMADESAYGPDTGLTRRHFETGLVGTIGVPAAAGLEIGGGRYFHASWPSGGISQLPWTRIFQSFLGGPSIGDAPDNQLASLFLRLAPPGKGFELYGEFGREDRGADFRDVLLEPDHDSGYLLGFARAWSAPASKRVTVFRAEVLDTRLSPLQQQRAQTPWYMHVGQYEGHTERGQVLGSVGAYGGGASVVAIDRYSPDGRTTFRWDRIVRATPRNDVGLPLNDQVDVIQAIGVERSRFLSRGELTASATLMKDFNRDFRADALNANIGLSYRVTR